MKRILMLAVLIFLLAVPVQAMEETAPQPDGDAAELLPVEQESFGKDLWTVIKNAVGQLQPSIAQAALTCTGLFGIVLLISVLNAYPGKAAQAVQLAAVLAVAALLLRQTDSLVRMGADTVTELSEYGKLLLPVMTASMAAQGGLTSSTALYTGTAIFDAVLSTGIGKLLVPLIYIFLALAVAGAATGEGMLIKLRDFIKWLVTWSLKMILYIFTGYITVTGVVSGTADAATVKATKLTMSGMIPVVGGILSDASEAVLVGAGLVKSAVGVYGLLAIVAIWITPFLTIGIQYLILKLTAALCDVFEVKQVSALIGAFSEAMGLLLGMVSALCILLLISTVCFMKGVS